MSETKQSIRTPLGRARGAGSAKTGTHHWWMQRVTGLVLVPLVFWLVWSFVHLAPMDHAYFTNWIARTPNTLGMIVVVLMVFYHAFLGTQVIIEDYIHHKVKKHISMIALQLFCLLGTIECIYAILKISFKG